MTEYETNVRVGRYIRQAVMGFPVTSCPEYILADVGRKFREELERNPNTGYFHTQESLKDLIAENA